MLEQERETLRKMLPELPAGRVAVIAGDNLLGVYDTESEALADAARKLGLKSFLMRRVGEGATEVSIPALALGIPLADSQHSHHRR